MPVQKFEARRAGSAHSISYRSGAFSRAKVKNREKVERYDAEGKLKVLLNSNVKDSQKAARQAIYVPQRCGHYQRRGIVPTGMLKNMGINVETKYGSE